MGCSGGGGGGGVRGMSRVELHAGLSGGSCIIGE